MISRRNFLKFAGLGSIALAAGYSTGKISNSAKSDLFVVHGFIPADENVIANLIKSFRMKIKSGSEAIIFSDSKVGEVVNRFEKQMQNQSFTKSGKVVYRIKRLNQKVDSDIILNDGSNSIYSVDDFNYSFAEIRNSLKNRKAELLFTAEFRNENLFSKIFNSGSRELVIENEKGIVDRLNLNSKYNNIQIDGSIGKTSLRIDNGIAIVNSSACKNGICKHSIASEVGNIIACAPNKVLIKVV